MHHPCNERQDRKEAKTDWNGIYILQSGFVDFSTYETTVTWQHISFIMIAAKKPANAPIPNMRLRSPVLPMGKTLEGGLSIEDIESNEDALLCSPGKYGGNCRQVDSEAVCNNRQTAVKVRRDFMPMSSDISMYDWMCLLKNYSMIQLHSSLWEIMKLNYPPQTQCCNDHSSCRVFAVTEFPPCFYPNEYKSPETQSEEQHNRVRRELLEFMMLQHEADASLALTILQETQDPMEVLTTIEAYKRTIATVVQITHGTVTGSNNTNQKVNPGCVPICQNKPEPSGGLKSYESVDILPEGIGNNWEILWILVVNLTFLCPGGFITVCLSSWSLLSSFLIVFGVSITVIQLEL
jgi:hypothetical protein